MVQIMVQMDDAGQITVMTSTPSEAVFFCLGMLRMAEKILLDGIDYGAPKTTRKKVDNTVMPDQIAETFNNFINKIEGGHE
jgi:hypothetical protein